MLTRPRYVKSEAVKMLERLEQDAYRKAHPMIPAAAAVPTKHRDDTANGLTRCILRYLTLSGWQAERINTMGRPIGLSRRTCGAGHTPRPGVLRWGKSTSTRGSADLSATIAGRSVKIEVKVGRDRQGGRKPSRAGLCPCRRAGRRAVCRRTRSRAVRRLV